MNAQEAAAVELPKAVGKPITIEAHGKKLLVKYHSRGTYFAQVQPPGEHARWGNKSQMRDDIKRFKATGSLPRETSGRSW